MRIFHVKHDMLGVFVAALLAGCGVLPLGPGATAQSSALAPARFAARRSSSGGYQLLYRFHPPEGTHPTGALLDVNGMLYGTTVNGGNSSKGTVYSVSTNGKQKVLYRFRGGSDGRNPQAGLLDVSGTLYGTTASGGSSNAGTVYELSTAHAEKVLYAFKGGSDGANPLAGLIDVKGTLYGTTSQGGGSGCYHQLGCGTIFNLTTSGKETVLHRFAGGSDGSDPNAGLIELQSALYGTTNGGGTAACECGTIYRITPAGVEKVLYAFAAYSDGRYPASGLIDVNGMLYGTTYEGGLRNQSGSGSYSCGTVYRINTMGVEKTIYRFECPLDGAGPAASLLLVDGVLYGTTTAGGEGHSCFSGSGCGTVYRVTLAGGEAVLYRFYGGTGGWDPEAPLTNVNGTLYGTTTAGGHRPVCCHVYGFGTVFAVTTP